MRRKNALLKFGAVFDEIINLSLTLVQEASWLPREKLSMPQQSAHSNGLSTYVSGGKFRIEDGTYDDDAQSCSSMLIISGVEMDTPIETTYKCKANWNNPDVSDEDTAGGSLYVTSMFLNFYNAYNKTKNFNCLGRGDLTSLFFSEVAE